MNNTKLIRLAQSGNLEAKNDIVEQNVRLVWSVVKRVKSTEHEKEDLFQIGCLGMVKAIDRFDFSFGVKFSTYAFTYILGEIRRFVRDDGRVKISRRVKEINYKVYKLKEEYINEKGREPTIGELAKILDVEKEELAIIIAEGANSKVKSLQDDAYQKDGDSISLMDQISSNEDIEHKIENKLLIKEALKKLDKVERQVIVLRYFQDKKQREISDMLGLTQVKVSRVEKKALQKMRV